MGRARFFRNDWWFCCPNETSSCVRQWVEAYLKNQYLKVSEVAYSTSLGSLSLSFNTRSEPLGNDKAGECCFLFILPLPYRTYAVRNVYQVPWSDITLLVPQNYLKMHWGVSYLGKDSIQPALWIQLVERSMILSLILSEEVWKCISFPSMSIWYCRKILNSWSKWMDGKISSGLLCHNCMSDFHSKKMKGQIFCDSMRIWTVVSGTVLHCAMHSTEYLHRVFWKMWQLQRKQTWNHLSLTSSKAI